MSPQPQEKKLRILVINDREITIVGITDFKQDNNEEGDFIIVENAKCIMRRGTYKHLQDLAKQGPTKSTILGEGADIKVSLKSVIVYFDCMMVNWPEFSL